MPAHLTRAQVADLLTARVKSVLTMPASMLLPASARAAITDLAELVALLAADVDQLRKDRP